MAKRKGEVDYEQFYLKNYDKNFKKKFEKRRVAPEHIEIVSVPVIGDVKIKTDDAIITYPEATVKNSDYSDRYEVVGMENGKINFSGSVSDVKFNNQKNRLYALKSADSKNTKKQRAKKSKFRSALYALLLIVICFCATLLSCDFLTGGKVMSEVTSAVLFNQKEYYRVYFAVQMFEFSSLTEAQSASDEIREKNGAGYILKDGNGYLVLGGIYKNREDAESVRKNLANDSFTGSVVFSVPVKKISVSLFPEDVQSEAELAFKYFFAVADKLYEISNDLDKGLTDEETAESSIKNLLKNLSVLEENFNNKSSLYETNVEVIRFKAQLNAVVSSVENLLNTAISRPNLLCDIRYTVALIVVTTRSYSETKSQS